MNVDKHSCSHTSVACTYIPTPQNQVLRRRAAAMDGGFALVYVISCSTPTSPLSMRCGTFETDTRCVYTVKNSRSSRRCWRSIRHESEDRDFSLRDFASVTEKAMGVSSTDGLSRSKGQSIRVRDCTCIRSKTTIGQSSLYPIYTWKLVSVIKRKVIRIVALGHSQIFRQSIISVQCSRFGPSPHLSPSSSFVSSSPIKVEKASYL